MKSYNIGDARNIFIFNERNFKPQLNISNLKLRTIIIFSSLTILIIDKNIGQLKYKYK